MREVLSLCLHTCEECSLTWTGQKSDCWQIWESQCTVDQKKKKDFTKLRPANKLITCANHGNMSHVHEVQTVYKVVQNRQMALLLVSEKELMVSVRGVKRSASCCQGSISTSTSFRCTCNCTGSEYPHQCAFMRPSDTSSGIS